MELKNEINISKEKANTVRASEIEKIKINKPSNYFISADNNEENLQINDFKDTKIIENQFLGDSEVSISSKIENNNIYKKWFYFEKNMTINLDHWELKFRKLNDSDNMKINFIQKKEFKFIDFEIYNVSNSPLEISDMQIDSTESITITQNSYNLKLLDLIADWNDKSLPYQISPLNFCLRKIFIKKSHFKEKVKNYVVFLKLSFTYFLFKLFDIFDNFLGKRNCPMNIP